MKPRLAYQPALDGVRAVAVAMVLLFHGGVEWMRGGYIGVSIFFTLSGYLITSLLLAESNATGSVRAGAFLARRARRLLPASAVCILGVALCSRYGLLDGVANLRRDLLGAAFQVQNWVLLASDDSYTEVLATVGGQRSPLEHYWSLAIEEQFYWMWPLVFGWLATRRRDRLMGWLTGLTVAAVVAAPLIAFVWGSDAAYWATPARLAEILFGAWLAVALTGRSLGASSARLAPLALGALVLAAILLPADGGLMYRGGLPLIGAASALLIAGLQAPGRLRGLLALAPLVGLGRISYGVYLYHWPIYVILDEARTGLSGPALLGLRVALTLLAATLSFVLIERPIRRADWRPRPTLAGAVVATMAVALAAILVPVTIADDYWRAAPDDIAALVARVSTIPTRRSATVSRNGRVDHRHTIGRDEHSGTGRADGSHRFGVRRRAPATVITTLPDATGQRAGADRAGARAHGRRLDGRSARRWARRVGRRPPDTRGRPPGGVAGLRLRAWRRGRDRRRRAVFRKLRPAPGHVLPDTLDEFRPEVVMLVCARRDLEDRKWSDEEGTIDPFDAAYQQRINDDYAQISELVTASGATAVFVRGPLVDPFWLGRETMPDYAERRAIVDGVMQRLAEAGGGVRMLDLRAWVEANGLVTEPDRATGRHALDARGGVRSDGSVARTGVAVDRPTIMSDLA